jgi:hypothetical protein
MRPDMMKAITAEGKAEGRVSGNNSWPINELQIGDGYVADGFGKIVEGTLIGSNLGNGIAAHTRTGFVFDAGIRDAEENREIPNFNGFYRGYDPSAWAQMTLTSINAPSRIARATVLPGDLVLAKTDGVFQRSWQNPRSSRRNSQISKMLSTSSSIAWGRTAPNSKEVGPRPKYDALAKWIDEHPDKLKMSRAQFNSILEKKKQPR